VSPASHTSRMPCGFPLLRLRGIAAQSANRRCALGNLCLDVSSDPILRTMPAAAARESGRRVSALIEEHASLADASARARERRLAAIPLVYLAEADAADREADRLEVEATNLEAESTRLRRALEKHDDWGYVAAAGKIDGTYVAAVSRGGPEFRIVDARGPRYQRLRQEAQTLRTQAAQGRFRQPSLAGALDADTLEELFAAVYNDAMRIGPSVEAIIAWTEAAIERERRRVARITGVDGFQPINAPTRWHLEWRGGVIDQPQSMIIQPEPAEVRADFDSASELIDVALLDNEPNEAEALQA
jgi:hypothetical protein